MHVDDDIGRRGDDEIRPEANVGIALNHAREPHSAVGEVLAYGAADLAMNGARRHGCSSLVNGRAASLPLRALNVTFQKSGQPDVRFDDTYSD